MEHVQTVDVSLASHSDTNFLSGFIACSTHTSREGASNVKVLTAISYPERERERGIPDIREYN